MSGKRSERKPTWRPCKGTLVFREKITPSITGSMLKHDQMDLSEKESRWFSLGVKGFRRLIQMPVVEGVTMGLCRYFMPAITGLLSCQVLAKAASVALTFGIVIPEMWQPFWQMHSWHHRVYCQGQVSHFSSARLIDTWDRLSSLWYQVESRFSDLY